MLPIAIIGLPLLILACVFSGIRLKRYTGIQSLFLSSMVAGTTIVLSLAFALNQWGLLLPSNIFICLGFITGLVTPQRKELHLFHPHFSRDTLYLLPAGITGVAIAIAILVHVPYPMQIDGDIIKETIRINFLQGTGVGPFFIPGSLRPIGWDYPLVLLGDLLGVNGTQILWGGMLATIPLYGLGTVFLARAFKLPWLTASVGGLFAVTICGFWALEGPALMLPEDLSALVSIYAFAFYLQWERKGMGQLMLFIGLLTLLNLGYYYALVILLPFVALAQIGRLKHAWILTPIAIGIFIGSILIYGTIFDAYSVAVFSISLAALAISSAYTPLLLAFIGVGMGAILFTKKRELLPLPIIPLVPIIGIFLPLGFFNRVEVFVRPELAILAAAGLLWVATIFTKRQVLGVSLIILAISPVLAMPYQGWVDRDIPVPGWAGLSLSVMSQDEANAGFWLQSHAAGGFIITDISSDAIMQSLSGLPGLFNPVYFLDNGSLLNQDYLALASSNPLPYLHSIGNYTFFMVITSRTDSSVKSYFGSNGNFPDSLVYYPLGTTPTPRPFDLVYQNPQVEIYEFPN